WVVVSIASLQVPASTGADPGFVIVKRHRFEYGRRKDPLIAGSPPSTFAGSPERAAPERALAKRLVAIAAAKRTRYRMGGSFSPPAHFAGVAAISAGTESLSTLCGRAPAFRGPTRR